MYWADSTGKILKANFNGDLASTVLALGNTIYDIELDPTNGKMYWANASLGKIQRANLVAPVVEDVILGLSSPLVLRNT
jgi:hypothetical protein